MKWLSCDLEFHKYTLECYVRNRLNKSLVSLPVFKKDHSLPTKATIVIHGFESLGVIDRQINDWNLALLFASACSV